MGPSLSRTAEDLVRAGNGEVVRWQGLTLPSDGTQAALVKEAKLVALADLKGALPENSPLIVPEDRHRELALRKVAFERRLR